MKQAGVKTILLDVLAAVESDTSVDRATVFTSPRSVRTFDFPRSNKIVEAPQPRAEHPLFRLLWYELGLPRETRRSGADVLLCLHDAGMSAPSIPHATFVQRPVTYSDEARRRIRMPARYRMDVVRAAIGRSCRSAGAVFVHTPSQKRAIIALFGLLEQNVETILPPPRHLPPPEQPARELEAMGSVPADRRILFVGQLFAHKNVMVVEQAMPQIRSALPGATLFVSGPQDEATPHGDGVVYLGALSDESLGQAYELATLLVMPSLHETIGLPMLEAMDAGTPVVAADLPYAHDVCGDAAVFFDPVSPGDCAETISRVLLDQSLQNTLSQLGQQRVESRRREDPYSVMLKATLSLATRRS